MDNLNIKEGEVTPEKLNGYDVLLYKRQQSIDKKIVGGKLLHWAANHEITFIENPPRGPRSIEVGRTAHARLVRLQDGSYSMRVKFITQEKSVGYRLIAELRELTAKATEDSKKGGAYDAGARKR